MDGTQTNEIWGFTSQSESRGVGRGIMRGAKSSRTPFRGLTQAGLVNKIGSSHIDYRVNCFSQSRSPARPVLTGRGISQHR